MAFESEVTGPLHDRIEAALGSARTARCEYLRRILATIFAAMHQSSKDCRRSPGAIGARRRLWAGIPPR